MLRVLPQKVSSLFPLQQEAKNQGKDLESITCLVGLTHLAIKIPKPTISVAWEKPWGGMKSIESFAFALVFALIFILHRKGVRNLSGIRVHSLGIHLTTLTKGASARPIICEFCKILRSITRNWNSFLLQLCNFDGRTHVTSCD